MKKVYLLWAKYHVVSDFDYLIRIYENYNDALKDLHAYQSQYSVEFVEFSITDSFISEKSIYGN